MRLILPEVSAPLTVQGMNAEHRDEPPGADLHARWCGGWAGRPARLPDLGVVLGAGQFRTYPSADELVKPFVGACCRDHVMIFITNAL